MAEVLPGLNELSALLSVVVIDVVLAGDNAIVVGMAAAGLPAARRRRAIILGIIVATALRIGLATITLQLLAVIGLTLAGGILLLWVSWKMYRELRATPVAAGADSGDSSSGAGTRPAKTTGQALLQIVVADLSMSLDNVLAIAGTTTTARAPEWVLVVGLVLSVALMGVASTFIARLLVRHHWISWVGLLFITLVALRMIWEGWAEILHRTGFASLGALLAAL